MLVTSSTVQTVVLPDDKRCACVDTPLWTYTLAGTAADTRIRDDIALFCYFTISKYICLPKNRMYTEIKILDFCLIDAENDADVPRLVGIDICKVRLFLKNLIPPLDLLIVGDCIRPTGQTDHFLIFCIT